MGGVENERAIVGFVEACDTALARPIAMPMVMRWLGFSCARRRERGNDDGRL